MDVSRLGVLVVWLLAVLPQGQCGTVLATVLPGPLSHLFGMKKVSEEIAARGHTLQVRYVIAFLELNPWRTRFRY